MPKPLIIAHRGASAYAPENTLAAFKKAINLGADGIELDVHLSKDGEVVVIHDRTIDRTSNGKGQVAEMSLKELKALDFGSWFSDEYQKESIPLLREVLELLKDWNGLLNIELKQNGLERYPQIEEKVLNLLGTYGFLERAIISSFDHYSLMKVKEIDPSMRICPLYMANLYKPWEYAYMLNAFAIHPHYHTVVPDLVKKCHEYNIQVNVYTVDCPEHIQLMVDAGVDGIITNVPDIAIQVRGQSFKFI
ncbi:glycerophosphodiester phosphodiesterase [Caldicoprobacter algeriensis]|uniref:glycerophosphodiester phosphodiesterase n=1 Tax=Caldicoprobacter algeriensis TaxID=699281 RepID=UPI00207A1D89|nr:glycerophosphodiester phosphodiesterase [Caldicoprobacter algeriensis]MCM8900782.1 glycerophosphodiester phosphodiesterase [Caldicoprobacter algeriensis]